MNFTPHVDVMKWKSKLPITGPLYGIPPSTSQRTSNAELDVFFCIINPNKPWKKNNYRTTGDLRRTCDITVMRSVGFKVSSASWIPSLTRILSRSTPCCFNTVPDSKVHGANTGFTWGRQDPGVPHVGPMNLAIRGALVVNVLSSDDYTRIRDRNSISSISWGYFSAIWQGAIFKPVVYFVMPNQEYLSNIRLAFRVNSLRNTRLKKYLR